MIEEGEGAVRNWFARMSACCAGRDFDGAERIFADDVVSFGTRADVVVGLSALRRNQWEQVWGKIEGFEIDLRSVVARRCGDLAWGVATWTSTGFDERHQPFDRPGRVTVTLERRPGKGWLATHTHFSLDPGTPWQTHGPPEPEGH